MVYSLQVQPDALVQFFNLIFSSKYLLVNSFFQASVSTLGAVLVGIPVAFVIARRNFPFKQAVKSLFLIPFVFPSILVVISFILVFGNNGWINQFLQNSFGFQVPVNFLYGFQGIILAHIFYNFPLVAKFVSTAWESSDKTMKEAAQTLGANRIQTFFSITVFQLLPSILASASLVFIYSFMSFAIVLSFGGIQFSTFEVEIFRQIVQNLNLGTASLLAVFQFFVLVLVSGVYFYFSKKFIIFEKPNSEKPKNINLLSAQGIVEVSILLLAILLVVFPFLSLILFAVTDPNTGAFTLKAFEKIFFAQQSSLAGTTPVLAIGYTLFFALAASVLAVFLGLLAVLNQTKTRFTSLIVSGSLAVSTITLGFGYLLGFGSGFFWLIILGHAVFVFPFSFRLLQNAISKIDPDELAAARVLGANRWRVLKFIQWPLMKKSVLVSLAFGFAVSLGELGFVLLMYDGIYPTMSVYVYRMLSHFDLGAAAGMGVVLIALSFFCFYFIEKHSSKVQVF
ncbi:MAG: iron ABC transporter permease [Candidatus Diapherotrites archaeon]|nr:iron ABC transporter permease [Candidatus Diapherotrites archaeon]